MKLFYLALLAFPLHANLSSINPEKLKASIAEKPVWMLERIAQDFAPFEDAVFAEEHLTEFFEEPFNDAKKECTFVEIKNNHLKSSCARHEKCPSDSREAVVLRAIQYLADTVGLPDVSFIFSVGDAYEKGKEPICCFAKNRHSLGILIPDVEALSAYSLSGKGSLTTRILGASERFPWKKKQPILFWRGATTGGNYTLNNWSTFPRAQLVLASHAHPDLINAKFSLVVQNEAGLFQMLENRGLLGDRVPEWASVHFKYLIDIDGNSCTYPRNYWILLSNSVLFKHDSPNIQWYYDLLEPWVNMIPIAADFSDLIAHIQWAKIHDNEAKKIADAGSKLAQQQLYPEAHLAYLYLVIENFSLKQKNKE